MSEWRDVITIARDIRDELRLIRKTLEAANANDPVAAMERAIAQMEPAFDEQEITGQAGNHVETVAVPIFADAPDIPMGERWRLG